MPAVVRKTDLCSGHSCFNPRPPMTWSNDVYANNLNAIRVGDGWSIHRCGKAFHPGVQVTGSPNVFVNNRPWARIGDQINCGSINAQGSPNVFANNGGSPTAPGFSGASYGSVGSNSDLEATY